MDIHSKKQVMDYVSNEGLTPVLNNTKWNRLFELLKSNGSFFQYRSKNINGAYFPEDGTSYTPEIEQYWGNFLAKEWLEIVSIRSHSRGALLKPEIEDFTKEAVRIAHEAGVKFTMTENGIKVWGYVRKSEHPEFVQRG